ncbi:MAG: hypothetical protein JO021_08075 [Alphaproteobacteria bacterium]|nr:hypothetical protein [Alphaproteobacteria bacterium]
MLEVDGDTVYLEAANGVEMQFSLRDLEVDAPPAAGERPRGVAPMRAGALRPGVPTAPAAPPEPDPKHQALLTRLPESVVGLAAVRYARDPKTQRAGWLNLDPTEKLQWVGRVTGLTIEKLDELSRTGKSRQIEAHAAVASKR